MKLYGQRFLKRSADKAAKQSTETKDAILWDVFTTERYCRCKIQGSNEFILARFPQNWSTIPSWCKPGQAVRIIHRGGIRGYIEIDGFGRAIPTPVLGNTIPTIETPPNAVLTGMTLRALANPEMIIWVEIGTVRFNGVTYYVPAVSVGNGGSLIRANMGLAIGAVSGIFSITAPLNYRIDAISIGSDLVVDITIGTDFTTTAIYPNIPSGNILIGYLLVRHSQTVITAEDIALAWTVPEASSLSTSVVDNGATQTITVTVKDQWGAAITTLGGWTISAEIDSGDGTLDVATNNTGAGNTCSFVYTEGTAGEAVFLHLSLNQGEVSLETYVTIQL